MTYREFHAGRITYELKAADILTDRPEVTACKVYFRTADGKGYLSTTVRGASSRDDKIHAIFGPSGIMLKDGSGDSVFVNYRDVTGFYLLPVEPTAAATPTARSNQAAATL